MPEKIHTIVVVVPARDEEKLLPAAVKNLQDAMDHFSVDCRRQATVMVVLDSCTDGSADVVAALAVSDIRIKSMRTNAGAVGTARALGIRAVLDKLPPSCLDGVWIANTDADTRVPADWLSVFASAADDGADAVAGTVEPDAVDLPASHHAAWQAHHARTPDHQHVHGANLGVRASAYVSVGGFSEIPFDEDVELVAALRVAGYDVRSSSELHAVTSGRLLGRAPHGFAGYLEALSEETTPNNARTTNNGQVHT